MNQTLVNILSILKEFEGIIGAVLGSTVTLVVTDILRHKGKLKIYVPNFELKLDFEENFSEKKNSEREIRGITIRYKIQIYNGSDICKIMRDFKIRFYNGKNVLFTQIPRDEATRHFLSHISFVDDMEVANIAPHEIAVIDQSCYLHKNDVDFEKMSLVNNIVLGFIDEKDKKHSVMLQTKQLNINEMHAAMKD